jgi:hypothetical protein
MELARNRKGAGTNIKKQQMKIRCFFIWKEEPFLPSEKRYFFELESLEKSGSETWHIFCFYLMTKGYPKQVVREVITLDLKVQLRTAGQ